jgi:PTS system N-acetylglucosamine-specific IIC component
VKPMFENLQSLGRALMLPIAVLPAAAIFLRLGQPDLLDIPFVAAAGDAVFHNLGLLFALGIAVGLAKENNGAAGLAGVVCFLVAQAGAKALMTMPPDVAAGLSGRATDLAVAAAKDAALFKLNVPTGIISGLIAGALYNRFHTIKLPEYLAFFGGRRFVPIAAGFSALLVALVIGMSWTAISHGMDVMSSVVVKLGAFGLFAYGALNRLLIVTGLHHILNSLAWFNLGSYHGVTGDLNRFFAGDPSAGAFMSGFFPIMMFGLPAACLAMYHTARPERRKEVGGMLASMALTAFLTGVTEPIEFSFMFLAPPLYAIHAVLTGLSMVLMNLIGVHLGFGFSAGVIDYAINFNRAQNPVLLLPVGLAYFALYYGIFRLAIVRFDLKTPGRETVAATNFCVVDQTSRGEAYLASLGGAKNLRSVDACTTRLRLAVNSASAIDEPRLRSLGAKGFVRPSDNTLQVVIGPAADQIASEIRAAMSQAGVDSSAAEPLSDAAAIVAALGGGANIRSISLCDSRIMVRMARPELADLPALQSAGVRSVAKLPTGIHLIVGPNAEALKDALSAAAGGPGR